MPPTLADLRATPFAARFPAVVTACLLVSEYVRRTVATPRATLAERAFFATPALALYSLLPLAFSPTSEVITTAVVTFALLWLAAFKTIGAVVGRGPLTDGGAWSPAQFAFALLLPVTVHVPSGKAQSPSKMRRVPSRSRVSEAVDPPLSPRRVRAFLGKLALLTFTAGGLSSSSFFPPGFVTAAAYVFALYALLGCVFDVSHVVSAHTVGLTLTPHFDAPFLASSYGDLWGRRWNLVAGHALRFLVFDAVVDGSLVPPRTPPPRASRARRAAAVTAAFVVSGLIHELILLYIHPGVSPYAGFWFLYFTSQAGFLVVESAVARAWTGAGLPPPPRVVANASVVGGGLAIAHALFLPPATHTDLAARVLASLQRSAGVKV